MNSIESEAKEDSGRVANNCCVFAWWHWPTKSERNGHRMGTLMVKFGRRHLEANLEEREWAEEASGRANYGQKSTTGHMLSEGNEAYITDGPWRVPSVRLLCSH